MSIGIKVITVLLSIAFPVLAGSFSWTMININSAILQGDAHLLRFPDGKVFMVDSGDNENVLGPYLKSISLKKIDKILVSHPHRDHFGGINVILDSGIKIDEVRINVPTKEQCDAENPRCDWSLLQGILERLKKLKVPVKKELPGECYLKSKDFSLCVLYAYDGLKTPIGKTDINDTSVILKLKAGSKSILFTGDLNQPMGEYLSKKGKDLKSDILKVPHHGTTNVAPNEFFDVVAPTIALVPSPKHLWESERSKRVRDYFTSKKIATYVNGIHGNVLVELQGSDSFTVKTGQ